MTFDLVVRNGLVIDGSGSERFRADVAIIGDRIAEIGDVRETGRQEIDADGLVVTPGFVDGHTHMDAQIFWDQLGTSSCWHGVTTVVMGNCGFTLAPARPDGRPLVVRNLERAEDISADAMAQGIRWTWSTFSEYLDAIETLPKGLNYAASVGHSALRTWAMGERAFEGPATGEDLTIMERELADALRAGAVAFTTSRSTAHATSDNRPVASRLASWDEVVALVELVGRESSAVFQLAPETVSAAEPESRDDYFRRLEKLAVTSGVPIVFGTFATSAWLPSLQLIKDTVANGGQMYGLTHCRGIANLQSFRTRLSFDSLPEWQDVRRRPLDEQKKLLLLPDVRSKLVHAAHHSKYAEAIGAEARKPDYDIIHIMLSPYLPNPTVAEEARRRGVDPVELMIDISLDTDFNTFFLQQLTVQQEPELVDLLRNPYTAMTFSDAGAHVSQISDASIQSHLLAYWVRERQVFTLEDAIPMITSQPARIWGLHDRGRLAPGYAADVTVFDPDTVAPSMPRLVADLPGGSRRLVQQAEGYAATIVNGRILTRDGEPGEERPGRLLRGGRIPVPART
jgi:N-acyl-D-aspartate/D-glutamate deacylase